MSEYRPILQSQGGDHEEFDDFREKSTTIGPQHTASNFFERYAGLFAVQTAFVIIQVIILVVIAQFYHQTCLSRPEDSAVIEDPFTPISSAVQYSVNHPTKGGYESSPYIGEPNRELDRAWSNLFHPFTFSITESEMRTMNKTSLALKDGSGYVGFFEVHHQLHCLKTFKQFRHLDHYPHAIADSFNMEHWDHCIDMLRRGVMCKADLTVNTITRSEKGLHDSSSWPRKCADWNSIQDFMKPRAVDLGADPFEPLWPMGDRRSIGPADLLD